MADEPAAAEAPAPPDDGRVAVTIDGRTFRIPKGELLIKGAQDHGVHIPRFCWHERMKPVGMCRQCLVQVDGVRGLPPACTTPVADGMVVHTQSDAVRKAQEGVLEFLLINHPLDCPVCDRGGECPLQDHTLSYGPGESRFVEEKRHHAKPIPISSLVDLDRERCILCARCTRFADEIAGDPLISFTHRGGNTQVLTFPDDPFTSYFSGNTVQICPVGALTSRPYRFRARPWDLEEVETSCTSCAVQCRTSLQSSTNRLVRLLGIDSEPVNQGWLCDKGRYGYEWVHHPDRFGAPMVRKEGELVEVSWPQALDAAAEGLREVKRLHGAGAIAVLGGARGTNEDAYAWTRFAKGTLGTDHVDAQLGDGLPAEAVLGLPRATIADCDRAGAVVLLGPDLKEELPILHLRLRRAAVELRVPLVELSPVDTGLTEHARAAVRHLPGEAHEAVRRILAAIDTPQAGTGVSGSGTPVDAAVSAAADALGAAADAPGGVVVVLGRPSLGEPPAATLAAAAALAALGPHVRFLSALRRGNVHGALDMGLAPGILPGRVALDAGGAAAAAWGAVPDERGLDAEGILRAAADGRVHGLVLLGADPLADFPDRQLAERALATVGFVVAVDALPSESNRRAEVVLPAAVWGEKSGTVTNLEGRVQRVARMVTPAGVAMEDWRIAAELAVRFEDDWDLESPDEVLAEIARVAPAYAGVAGVRVAPDGVVVPVTEVTVPIRRRDTGAPAQPGVADAAAEGPAVSADLAEAGGHADDDEGAEAGEVTVAVADGPPPALLTWDGAVDPPAAGAPDGYALRLVVGRRLYDGGATVAHGPSLAPLAPGLALGVNPADLERLGVEAGGDVRITTARGSGTITVVADPGVPRGVGRLPHHQPGDDLDLIDVALPVTDARLETLGGATR
jgi:NADH-quinone oxidoreductase subunit G